MTEKFKLTEVEVISPETINSCKDESEIKGEIWPAVTCNEPLVSYECRNADVARRLCEHMNNQEKEITYWKHKVSSLLWILGQFEDRDKVRDLIKEVEEEGYSICDKK